MIYRPLLQIVSLAAGAFLAHAILPVEAGPVAGAKTCGPYAARAPSTIRRSGSGTVANAIVLKEANDLRDALICLINAERKANGRPALARNKQLDAAALGHAGEAQRLKWWGSGNPHVNPEKGPQDAGSAIAQRIRDAGYCPAGATRFSEVAFNWVGAGNAENPGGASPVGAVNWWMNISKSGHREAILDPAVKEIGTGISGQSADRNLQPQAQMGTYVVNFAACPTTISPSPSVGTRREPPVGILTAPKHGKIPAKP